jgi:hypothetical protein
MRGFGAPELWVAAPLSVASIRKTPPASEDADGVLHAFISFEIAALEKKMPAERVRSRLGEIIQTTAQLSIYSTVGNLTDGGLFQGFVPGVRMPSSKNHRKQAEIGPTSVAGGEHH